MAIEFVYKGETYRKNNEYLTPTFAYRVPGVKFWVFLVHFKWVDGWCDPDYDTIGQYSSMDELLEKCKIDGVLLREIIVDPNTEEMFKEKYHKYNLILNKLELLNPLNILSKGYSVVSKNDEIIKDSDRLKVGDNINIRLSKGKINAKVEGIE